MASPPRLKPMPATQRGAIGRHADPDEDTAIHPHPDAPVPPPPDRGSIPLIVAAVAVGALLVCGGGLRMAYTAATGWLVVPESIVRPVRTLTVQPGGGALDKTFSGAVRAGDEARLSFKVAGSVSRVHVRVGSTVSAGDPIAELDTIDYQLQLQQLQASVASANAGYKNAQGAYDRVRQLYASNNVSRADLDSARAAADSARAGLNAASQQRKLAAQQVSYATLTAPRDASVADVLVNEGENVSAGQPVALLASNSRPEVVIGVPGALIKRVSNSMDAEVTVAAAGDVPFLATIHEVGVATSAATTFPVTVRFDDTTEAVLPGMSAEVRLQFPALEEQSHIHIPAWAAAEDREGRFVYIVTTSEDGLGTISRRPVRLGQLTGQGVEVTEGLQAGEHVVTAGLSRVSEGMVVRPERSEDPL